MEENSALAARLEMDHARIEYIHPVTRQQFCAVKSVSFTVNNKDIVSVVGPSGCGKSTLLAAAAGLLPYTGGEIRIDGSVVRKPTAASSVVFQKPALLPWKTAIENVMYPLRLAHVKREIARDQARDVLDKVGLSAFTDHYPHQLSGGMQQRVSVARAMVTGPELLLLDEPFAALDAQMREILQEEVMALLENSNMSGVLVTHQIDEAVLIGDRVVILTAGPETTVRDIIDVPFPRPRSPELRTNPEFLALVAEVSQIVRSEVHETEIAAGVGA